MRFTKCGFSEMVNRSRINNERVKKGFNPLDHVLIILFRAIYKTIIKNNLKLSFTSVEYRLMYNRVSENTQSSSDFLYLCKSC